MQASGAIAELKSESLHLRHPAMELSHVSRIRREAISPSFVPSSAAAHKSLHKGHQAVISGPPPPTASGPSQMRPDVKLEHTEHRSFDTVKLLTVSEHTVTDTDRKGLGISVIVRWSFYFFNHHFLSSSLCFFLLSRNIRLCGRA